jgi:indolepyruvate ferredoxin oxidoreductase
LPDAVRGYEDIKLANVATFRSRSQDLLAELEALTASTKNAKA